MAQYKVVFDRKKCIGALNCVGAAPDFWKMAKDGKVDLLNSKESKKQIFELAIDEKDFKQNQIAAQVCPAKAIKVEKI
jgi:ferredoxin